MSTYTFLVAFTASGGFVGDVVLETTDKEVTRTVLDEWRGIIAKETGRTDVSIHNFILLAPEHSL